MARTQNSKLTENASSAPSDNPPWYRLPIVWMVISGPALVVVAGFATLAIAIRYPDPVISAPVASKSDVPAVQARNHAATPAR